MYAEKMNLVHKRIYIYILPFLTLSATIAFIIFKHKEFRIVQKKLKI